MIKTPLLLMIAFLFTSFSIASAQEEIAPFVWKKHKPLSLNEKNILLLTNRTWATYRQYHVIQDTASIRPTHFLAFKFTQDGQMQGASSKESLNATWKLKGKKALQLTLVDSTSLMNSGDYAVYKLNETELVLVEISKKGAPSGILYCKGNKANVFAEPYQPNPVTPAPKIDPKELEVAREKKVKAALLPEIQTEMMLRSIKPTKKLEEMDVKSLEILRKQVLAGTYGLNSIKS